MTISKEQREKNTHNKHEYIAGVGNKHGEMNKRSHPPQKGIVARATYESAHEMGHSTYKEDPKYASSNWENTKHKPNKSAMKEHEHPYWNGTTNGH